MKTYPIHCRDFITSQVTIIPDIEFDEREWTDELYSDSRNEAMEYNSNKLSQEVLKLYPDLYSSELNRGLHFFNKKSDYSLKVIAFIDRR
jgi:hypothetical protein